MNLVDLRKFIASRDPVALCHATIARPYLMSASLRTPHLISVRQVADTRLSKRYLGIIDREILERAMSSFHTARDFQDIRSHFSNRSDSFAMAASEHLEKRARDLEYRPRYFGLEKPATFERFISAAQKGVRWSKKTVEHLSEQDEETEEETEANPLDAFSNDENPRALTVNLLLSLFELRRTVLSVELMDLLYEGLCLPMKMSFHPGEEYERVAFQIAPDGLIESVQEHVEKVIDRYRPNWETSSGLVRISLPNIFCEVDLEGNSADLALAVGLEALRTRTRLSASIALTGAIDWSDGSIQPVDGIAEKVQAAARRGLNAVIVPKTVEAAPITYEPGQHSCQLVQLEKDELSEALSRAEKVGMPWSTTAAKLLKPLLAAGLAWMTYLIPPVQIAVKNCGEILSPLNRLSEIEKDLPKGWHRDLFEYGVSGPCGFFGVLMLIGLVLYVGWLYWSVGSILTNLLMDRLLVGPNGSDWRLQLRLSYSLRSWWKLFLLQTVVGIVYFYLACTLVGLGILLSGRMLTATQSLSMAIRVPTWALIAAIWFYGLRLVVRVMKPIELRRIRAVRKERLPVASVLARS